MLSRTALSVQHQALSRTNAFSHRILSRSMHMTFRVGSNVARRNSLVDITKRAPALGNYSKRYASTTETTTTSADGLLRIVETQGKPAAASTADVASTNAAQTVGASPIDPIPDVPVPPAQTVVETVSYVGEPPLEALGLGGWWPPGMVQQGLEFFHVGLGLPWWECIAIGTFILRLSLFPLVIISQRNAVAMNNALPEMQRIQEDMADARLSGNQLQVARHAQELTAFMKSSNCNPLKNMIVPLAQAPIFISCFMGLRRMAEYPVESMKHGGLWWFEDLTIADPYYLLPLITAGTLALTIELGTDSARAEAMGKMRTVLRVMPLVVFPFTLHFPGAVLCYWASSNFFSLIQVGFLRLPKVRTFFNIPQMVIHPRKPRAQRPGFVDGFKTSWKNMKTTRELNARAHVEDTEFLQAGRGPLRKTYLHDPTKRTSTQPKLTAVQAKKR